jgi:hypothetical protein
VTKTVNPSLVIIAMAALWLGAAIGLRGFLVRGHDPSTPAVAQVSDAAGEPADAQPAPASAAPAVEPPVFAGPFLIVAPGWVDPNPAHPPAAAAVSSHSASFDPHDIAALKASPYWATIGHTTSGYTQGAPVASAASDGEIASITWDFEDKDFRGFEVVRATWDLPIEIQRLPPDGPAELLVNEVNGTPAVFIRNKPGRFGPQILYMVDARGILTVIDGEIPDFMEFIRVAESITP